MITAERLTKRFDDLVTVNDVSFGTATGEILGFLGPNGDAIASVKRVIGKQTYNSS
jgi:ABC-2 type transport system ATP-binding protein